MSKTLVQKALNLLQDSLDSNKQQQTGQNKQRKQKIKKKQALKRLHSGLQKDFRDRTEANLFVIEQLRTLRPKASVAQKVVEFYTQRKDLIDPKEKDEPQKSILFDDDDDLKKKKRKMLVTPKKK